MNPILSTLVVVAMLATLGVLVVGVLAMAKGGEFNRKHANHLMRWRIAFQASALLLLAITLWLAQG